MSGSAPAKYSPAQVRSLILQSATPVCQPVGSPQTVVPAAGTTTTLNVIPRGVGLLRKFYVPTRVTVTTPAGTTLARAATGPANIFSNITFTDLNNLVRHNTSGRHLTWINSAKRAMVVGAADTTDTTLGFGSNFNGVSTASSGGIWACAASVAASSTSYVYGYYEIPVQYTDKDFSGAIWLGTTQASVQLALTLNPSFFVQSTATDQTQAVFVWTGTTAPTITQVQINPYMLYWDQLPVGADGLPLLPLSDMSQVYQLNESIQNGMVANSEFSIPYSNLRNIVSTTMFIDNGGTLYSGTDVSYFKLSAANLYLPWQKDPFTVAYETRCRISDDLPAGGYYFDSRDRPINTNQSGNQNIIVNMSVVNSGAQIYFGQEFFASALTLAGGGSIQSA